MKVFNLKIMSFKEFFKIFFIFISLLYILIPFETSNSSVSLQIRLVTAIVFILFAFYTTGFKIFLSLYSKYFLILIITIVFISASQSMSLRFFVFIIVIFFGLTIVSSIQRNYFYKKLFLLSLKYLIIFSILMFFIQFFVYQLTGNIIKLHEYIYPLSEARIELQENFNLVRMGGIYLEPGTYSNYMYVFLMIYLFITKNLKSPLLFFGACSMILSYSVWGIIFGFYLLIILIFNLISNVSLKKKFILFIFIFSFSFYSASFFTDNQIVNFAMAKINGDTYSGSVSSKKDTYKEYKENFYKFLLIGEGFDPSFRKGESAPQDSGFILNLSVVFGIIFTFFILLIFIIKCIKNYNFLFFIIMLPIFFSKIYYWDYAFWLFYFFVINDSILFNSVNKVNGEIK